MRIVPILLALSFLAFGLAGCIGTEDELDTAEGKTEESGDRAIGTGEALLTGRVLNDGLEPIDNATVKEKGSGLNTTTDAEGVYHLVDLEPGLQTIVVEAFEHAPTSAEVELADGALTQKDFLLERVRGATPYVAEPIQQTGLLECQLGLVLLLANCIPIQNVLNEIGTNPTNTKQIHKWHIEPVDGLRGIVLEMVWEPTSLTLAEELVLLTEPNLAGVSGGDWGRVQGESILRYEITNETILDEMKENATQGEPYQTRVFPPSEAGNTVYDQRFTIFASHFYYSLPSDDYSGVPEGYTP